MRTILFLLALIRAAVQDYEYDLTYSNCITCFAYHTACINEDMTKAVCCAWDENSILNDNDFVLSPELLNRACISNQHYCTSNLTYSHYKRLVCPQNNCPGGDPLIF
jgi:hypothetical protein